MKVILQSGVAKSGNYWLYKILDAIYTEANIECRSYIRNHSKYKTLKDLKLSFKEQASIDTIKFNSNKLKLYVSNIYEEQIKDPSDYFDKCSIVWTHTEFNRYFYEFEKDISKIIYLVRDPRDVFLSKVNFAFGDYSQKFRKKRKDKNGFRKNRRYTSSIRWLYHNYLAIRYKSRYPDKIHFTHYENLLSSTKLEVKKILEFLQIELKEEQIESIITKTSAKFLSEENQGHISPNINIYKWKNILTQSEITDISNICKPMLKLYNYPLTIQSNENPIISDFDFKKLKVYYQYQMLKYTLNYKMLKSVIFGDRTVSETFLKIFNILKTLK